MAENDVVNNEVKIKYDKSITFLVSSHLLHFDDISCYRLFLIKFLYRFHIVKFSTPKENKIARCFKIKEKGIVAIEFIQS